jgi:NAD(P) transhydrogenase subunit alpha
LDLKSGGAVRLVILKETAPGETRVALVPETVKNLVAKGITVQVENGAGLSAGATDAAYEQAGATLSSNRASLLAEAEVLPVVNTPPAADLALLSKGSVVIGFLKPLEDPKALLPAVEQGVTLFSVELVPRISRAQSIDALSSMGTVAGYKAVILAAERLPKMFPLLMTAAGTVPPAKVFVLGAGVAGLQAIATARRLGAMVESYDVRAAAGEQVRSLGAKFLEVDLGGIETEDKGGYAKELSEEALERGRQLITKTAAYSDVIITTAQVPGRRAPLLIRKEAVEAMKPGSLIVDLAASSGGNCELTEPGKEVVVNGVTIYAPLNLAVTVPVHASQLYSRNLANFLQLIAKDGVLTLNWEDEVLTGSCVARDGSFVHPRVLPLVSPAAQA